MLIVNYIILVPIVTYMKVFSLELCGFVDDTETNSQLSTQFIAYFTLMNY